MSQGSLLNYYLVKYTNDYFQVNVYECRQLHCKIILMQGNITIFTTSPWCCLVGVGAVGHLVLAGRFVH